MPLFSVKFPLIRAKDINRLITSLSPTGKIIMQDDMEDAPIKWGKYGHVDATVTQDTTYPFSGGASMKLWTPLVAEALCEALRFFSHVPQPRLGLEGWFAIYPGATYDRFQLGFEWNDGTNAYYALLRYVRGEEKWKIASKDGALIEIPELPAPTEGISSGVLYWYHIKLIADFNTYTYVKVVYGNREVDLSNYEMWTKPSTVFKGTFHILWEIRNSLVDYGSINVYIDDVILTNEEP